MGKFPYLSVGKLFVFLETLRHNGRVVVDISIRRGPFVRPVVVAMPVGLGEIEPCPEAFLAEGIDHRTRDVGFGITALRQFTSMRTWNFRNLTFLI